VLGAGSDVSSSSGSSGSSGGGSDSGWSSPIAGSGQPVKSRIQMLYAVKAAKQHGKRVAKQIRAAAAVDAQLAKFKPWIGPEVTPAAASSEAAAAAAAAGAAPDVLNPAFMQADFGGHAGRNSSWVQNTTWGNSTSADAVSVSIAAAAAATDRNISAALFASGGWNTNNFLWQGWGMNYFYFDYYQWWREHYFLRNLYMNTRIPPRVNPCK
jgi:hypothetical protein